ncbi:MAG: glycosyltransferase family 4 protein [Deltaproteobacteria bacterium]|jgi:glycosyltransferase involved in cell wall biosynthesis|nr:glycosyltransferase family 4 protein [Deltaproteobacteria bacterium]
MRLKIGFFTDGVPFEGDSLETGALGGAETAFIQMTRAMARLGHEVMAINNCQEPAVHDNVSYHPFRKSLPLLAHKSFDVMVVSRFFGFFSLPIKSRLKALWNHDTLDNPQALRAVHDEIDICYVLSEFHRHNYLTRLPQLEERTVVTRNGLDLNLLDRASQGARKVPGKVIYASRPERGLKPLLEDIWPRLSASRPELRLHLCGYNVSEGMMDKSLLGLYDYLSLLAKKDTKIIPLGSLPKAEYYRHLAESELMAYPSTFPEVSCLAVLEAQALGTAVLTSDSYALSESVAVSDFKVSGRPASKDYLDMYVDRALALLGNRDLRERLASQARAKVRSRHNWDLVASEWARIFELALRAKESRPYLLEVATSPKTQRLPA